jgi:hypothetical protein
MAFEELKQRLPTGKKRIQSDWQMRFKTPIGAAHGEAK